MPNYDDHITGLHDDNSPMNLEELNEEIELSEAEIELAELKKQISGIKSLFKTITKMEADEGIYANCLGMDEETEETYIRYKKSLEIKINRL